MSKIIFKNDTEVFGKFEYKTAFDVTLATFNENSDIQYQKIEYSIKSKNIYEAINQIKKDCKRIKKAHELDDCYLVSIHSPKDLDVLEDCEEQIWAYCYE